MPWIFSTTNYSWRWSDDGALRSGDYSDSREVRAFCREREISCPDPDSRPSPPPMPDVTPTTLNSLERALQSMQQGISTPIQQPDPTPPTAADGGQMQGIYQWQSSSGITLSPAPTNTVRWNIVFGAQGQGEYNSGIDVAVPKKEPPFHLIDPENFSAAKYLAAIDRHHAQA